MELEKEVSTAHARLSEAVKQYNPNPKPHHYINEFNMINRIVLEMNSKKYRERNKCTDIRNNCSSEELHKIVELQNGDVYFIKAGMDFQTRKKWLKKMHKNIKIEI